MNFSKEDMVIIEQALKTASKTTSDYKEIEQYESVRQKLNTNGENNNQLDGFRYDYDDNM